MVDIADLFRALRLVEIETARHAGWHTGMVAGRFVLYHPLGVNARAMSTGKAGDSYLTPEEAWEADTPEFSTHMKELTDLLQKENIRWSLRTEDKVFAASLYLLGVDEIVFTVTADIALVALLLAFYRGVVLREAYKS